MIHCEHAFLNNHRFSDFGCQRNVIANKYQLTQIGKSTLALKHTSCAIQFQTLSSLLNTPEEKNNSTIHEI